MALERRTWASTKRFLLYWAERYNHDPKDENVKLNSLKKPSQGCFREAN
jgi:hypothetical protein